MAARRRRSRPGSRTPRCSSISVKTSGQTINEKVHVTVKGGGTQSVTVPAGTYQATVVDQTMAETVLGHRVNTVVRTWLAPGVGPVQSEVLDKGTFGEGLLVRQELKSFTQVALLAHGGDPRNPPMAYGPVPSSPGRGPAGHTSHRTGRAPTAPAGAVYCLAQVSSISGNARWRRGGMRKFCRLVAVMKRSSPLAVGSHAELVLQVERCLVDAQGLEELRGRHEDRELQLGQAAAARNVHGVETGPVHAQVDGRSVGWRGRTAAGRTGGPSAVPRCWCRCPRRSARRSAAPGSGWAAATARRRR